MRLITYDIHLLEPLLVTALDGDPNSSISYNFIPGSVLRGALIGSYQHAGNEIDSTALRSLFFSPDAQYLNGYRTLYDKDALEEVRCWPLPLSLRREEVQAEEEKSFKVYDLAWISVEDTERLSTPFGILDSDGQMAQIERQVTTHIQRDRHLGRSTRESGEIYNYEALSAGQTFRAHILTTLAETEIQPVVDLLAGELHLGGSRSAGYGRVRFELVENPADLEAWLAQRYPAQKPAGKVTITLLSDLLLRDGNGNWTTDPRAAARSMGLELDTAFRAVRPIGAFNRKWGLPLPQRMALKMGTVLVCRPPTDAQWQQLKDLVENGMGESREDGYGRIAVNWHTQSNFTMSKPDAPEAEIIPLLPDSAGRQIAGQMVARMWRSQLEQRIVAKANDLADKAQIKASKSQLHRLRQKVQATLQKAMQAQQPDTPESHCSSDVITDNLRAYMKDLEARRSTRDQFQKTRVNKTPLLEWISDLLKETAPSSPDFTRIKAQIGDVQAVWSEIATLEANLRLMDAVLAQMVKKTKEADNE